MPPLSDRKRGYILYSLFFCAKPHKRNATSFRLKIEDIFYILSFFAKPHKRNVATFVYCRLIKRKHANGQQ